MKPIFKLSGLGVLLLAVIFILCMVSLCTEGQARPKKDRTNIYWAVKKGGYNYMMPGWGKTPTCATYSHGNPIKISYYKRYASYKPKHVTQRSKAKRLRKLRR